MRHETFLTDMHPEIRPALSTQKRKRRMKSLNANISLESEIEYFLIEEMSHSFGLSVDTLGQQKIRPSMTYPSMKYPEHYDFNVKQGRILEDYLLVYITEGEGTFHFKKSEWGGVKVKGGYLFWLVPGQWHSYAPRTGTGWTEYYISFKGEVIRNLIRDTSLENKNCVFDLGYNDELVSLFLRALELARFKNACYQSYLSGIVLHMLGLVMSHMKEQMDYSCTNDQKMEQAKIIMKEKISMNLDMRELAKTLGLSYSWFRKLFKDYTGLGPARYFLELKMEKIKRLLATTDMPIKECLFRLGYNNAENFHTMFKKNTGYTPIEYRRVMIEEKAAGRGIDRY